MMAGRAEEESGWHLVYFSPPAAVAHCVLPAADGDIGVLGDHRGKTLTDGQREPRSRSWAS